MFSAKSPAVTSRPAARMVSIFWASRLTCRCQPPARRPRCRAGQNTSATDIALALLLAHVDRDDLPSSETLAARRPKVRQRLGRTAARGGGRRPGRPRHARSLPCRRILPQADVSDDHAPVDGLAHVINSDGGDRGTRTSSPHRCGPRSGGALVSTGLSFATVKARSTWVREIVAQRHQFRRTLRGHDARHFRHCQHVPSGAPGSSAGAASDAIHTRARPGPRRRVTSTADVDHASAASSIDSVEIGRLPAGRSLTVHATHPPATCPGPSPGSTFLSKVFASSDSAITASTFSVTGLHRRLHVDFDSRRGSSSSGRGGQSATGCTRYRSGPKPSR